ncbi:hypothetical protein GCM10010216_61140 [Streptomyces flaveolus]|nr:hypothetical protein GCM10010216_61140 [Streptomyces flaveolus]
MRLTSSAGRITAAGSSPPIWAGSPRTISALIRGRERYGGHPALALRAVHNEHGVPVSACYCDSCAAHFRRRLATTYGTVDAVNETWGRPAVCRHRRGEGTAWYVSTRTPGRLDLPPRPPGRRPVPDTAAGVPDSGAPAAGQWRDTARKARREGEMPRTPAHTTRLDILEWLKDPVAHFPPQRRPDALAHGVGADLVAARLGVPRRVAKRHLRLLVALGLLRTSRIRRRTYYRRDEVRIAEVARMFEKGW